MKKMLYCSFASERTLKERITIIWYVLIGRDITFSTTDKEKRKLISAWHEELENKETV